MSEQLSKQLLHFANFRLIAQLILAKLRELRRRRRLLALDFDDPVQLGGDVQFPVLCRLRPRLPARGVSVASAGAPEAAPIE